jgi:Flp pilus assembly protein TadG
MKLSPWRKSRPGGHAAVEVALMSPWIFLLFIAVVDFGFYAYALISVENAARVGAFYASSTPGSAQDSAGACQYVLDELRTMPNIGNSVTTCGGSSPVSVTATLAQGSACPEGIDTPPPGIPVAQCTQVAVTYTTLQMFPLPWLTGQMTVTRIVQARVR